MFKDFRLFLLRGNVVDLAVAVVIGAAFGSVIASLVDDLLSPVIGLVGGADFGNLVITLKEADGSAPAVQLRYGAFVNSIITFVVVAGAIFFVVVKPLGAIAARRRRGDAPADDTPAPSDEALLLTDIRDLLRAQRAGTTTRSRPVSARLPRGPSTRPAPPQDPE